MDTYRGEWVSAWVRVTKMIDFKNTILTFSTAHNNKIRFMENRVRSTKWSMSSSFEHHFG